MCFVCMVHVFSLCGVGMENKWSLARVYGTCVACDVYVLSVCEVYM